MLLISRLITMKKIAHIDVIQEPFSVNISIIVLILITCEKINAANHSEINDK